MEERFHKLVTTIEHNSWPVYGLEIRKNGALLRCYGDTKDTRHPIYSATKSFVFTAAGIAVREGNCPAGHFYGASQMELTVEELGRLGQLYLNGGTWNGERLDGCGDGVYRCNVT